MTPVDVAVVGSGFAGTILARALHARGLSVVLLERGEHPRFALGESSTPLGNLCLERLAHTYGLHDLWHLAQHGRWTAYAPEVHRGLKRGFTFYRHRPGEPLPVDAENSARLLVAASPDDEIADTHWLRADVDAFLVDRAVEEGVEYRPNTEVIGAKEHGGFVTLEFGDSSIFDARFVVDASGPGGALARAFGLSVSADGVQTRSGMIGTHFTGVPEFETMLADSGRAPRPGPYPADWGAVHHWIDEGWLYALRFDDGRVSAGVLFEGEEGTRVLGGVADAGSSQVAGGSSDPEALFCMVVGRYPDLAEWFGDATAVEPWVVSPRLQRRASRATGARWALLPHAYGFVDPLFSTGIAWTLLGVERLAGMVDRAAGTGDPAPGASELERYAVQLEREYRQIDTLIAGAYDTRTDFRLTVAHTMLYFAAVSWAETLQRLQPSDDDAWTGFLGVDDPFLDTHPEEAREVLHMMHRGGGLDASGVPRFEHWVEHATRDRNVAGLADPTKDNLYGIDLADLSRNADLLEMTKEEILARLDRVRGTSHPGGPMTVAGTGASPGGDESGAP